MMRHFLYFCFWRLSEIKSKKSLIVCPKCHTKFKETRPEIMDIAIWQSYDNQPRTGQEDAAMSLTMAGGVNQ